MTNSSHPRHGHQVKSKRGAGAFLCIVLTLPISGFAQPAAHVTQHGRAFWQAVASNNYDPPAGAQVEALSSELSRLLASPDPQLRDEFAYSILASWIYDKRILSPPKLHALMVEWMRNLERGGWQFWN